MHDARHSTAKPRRWRRKRRCRLSYRFAAPSASISCWIRFNSICFSRQLDLGSLEVELAGLADLELPPEFLHPPSRKLQFSLRSLLLRRQLHAPGGRRKCLRLDLATDEPIPQIDGATGDLHAGARLCEI